jgi:hypothetical protein
MKLGADFANFSSTMSRVFVALLVCCIALNSFSATQTIQADSGPNFVAVNLKVGENRLTDLFPNAPVGTLVFKFDNSAGWSAAQMYPSGWSHPNLQILPWGGCIMYLPANTSINFTLEGEVIPLPRPDYIAFGQGIEQIYTGWNLVSLSLVNTRSTRFFLTFDKSRMLYNSYQWDDLDVHWLPVFPSRVQAVWVYGSSLAHPNGAFTTTNTALYFNNYAPAYGIDQKFRGVNCEPLTNGTAQILRRVQNGATEAVGAAVAISSEFPGYIEPTADLVRYLPGGSSYSVRVQSGTLISETESSSAPDFGLAPPIFPQPMPVFYPTFAFRSQPQDASARPGATVELSAIFQNAHILDPLVTLDVPYQWQKHDGSTWIDVPNATSATLRIENIQPADSGAYRLRATACDEYYSRTATVSLIAPLVASQLQAGGKVRLQVTLPVTTKAVVQTSTDLQHWSEAITINTPTNEWAGEVALELGAKFYRVVEMP